MKHGVPVLVLSLLFPAILFAQQTQIHSQNRAAPQNGFVTLKGNVHPMARGEFDRGVAPDSLPQRRMVLMLQRSPARETALQNFLDTQQTKGSSNYHKWLSPAQFGQQFGATDADLQNVTSWLRTNGFQLNRVASGRGFIEFSGNAGQVRQAFRTEIHRYVVNGQEHWANSRDPQIPANLAPLVKGILSLHNFPRQPMARVVGNVLRSRETGAITPLFTFKPPRAPTLFGIGPADFGTIYNLGSGFDGTGETIGIVAESNVNTSDVDNFRALFNLPVNHPQVILNGPDPGLLFGAETEAVADLEWSGAVARNAKLDLVVSSPTETTAGVDLSALYIVDNNLADIISESFGDCEAFFGPVNAFYSSLWEQAAAQGITAIVSSGDNGSAGCDFPELPTAFLGLAVNGAASTPFDIAVGGTDFDDPSPLAYFRSTNDPNTGGSAISYIPEKTWNDSCVATLSAPSSCTNDINHANAGGSGGPSSLYPKPAWQVGLGNPNDPMRDIPDVSLFAGDGESLSFYLMCEADMDVNNAQCNLNTPLPELLGVGGTSISAQAFAGVMALVDQSQNGQRQGNANYMLYNLAKNKNPAGCNSSMLAAQNCIFYDITKGNNSVACDAGSPNCSGIGTDSGILVDPNNPVSPAWNAGVGFDVVTGLGSVNIQNLIANWPTFAATATTLSASPMTVIHGQPVTVNITVAPASNPAGTPVPTGDVSLIGAFAGPPARSQGMGMFSLDANGSVVSANTTTLAGGTYMLAAHYGGDGNFAESESAAVGPITVTPETSKTLVTLVTFDPNTGLLLSPNATTAAYGSPYIVRMDVNSNSSPNQVCAQSGKLPIDCPTGTILLTNNGAPLDAGTFSLNSEGFSEDLLAQFSPGNHSLQGQYSGDSSYQPSTSSKDLITITQAATSIAVEAPPALALNTSAALMAQVNTTSSGVSPTGTVTFFANGKALPGNPSLSPMPGSASGSASLQATLTATFSTPGPQQITASYSGDGNYLASGLSAGATIAVGADFGVSTTPATLSIAAGQNATTTLTLTELNGYSQGATFTCAVPTNMTLATCTVAPTSVTPAAGATTGTATVTISTTASRTASLHHGSGWLVGSTAVFACIFLLGAPETRRRSAGLIAIAIVGAMTFTASSCGGGGSATASSSRTVAGTPAGTYTVVVTGSAPIAGQTVTHSSNVSVTVQ